MQSAQMSIPVGSIIRCNASLATLSVISRILNGACCFLPKLGAGLQVSHIGIIANQTGPCLLFCAWVLFRARRLEAYTLTLR